ncbi:MAG: aromatic/alkene monooxygenase hydroxylase subunit beta [Hydrogenophaga sp.]|uniref:aromatic/alkene monooxygenase hydroxylase subunit beta n=1 Tax=Hydrogenophaga sp. TaxID=1904254 RepID=UPI00272543D0|nr:aromatic/alkene monooxygenase hydroxylase subunit beta [Hydrogenophaga sp.]MDO9479922.1 aromatic/alkene monooxygenase hydroxylase subunit beta [Hydrogenophaga sp.]MDP3345716.1 aromatic/alkene monooxygenase hydroxylase subunit beta [Hydrogenophaga sp.]MDP3807548.1 aromatic/alkene monooxygenase hydroxylase subunit beta [Hydrogenophaga sp.]
MNIDLQAREITPLRNTFDHVARHIGDKVASRYQEATYGAQPMVNFHYRPTWDPAHALFDASRSQIVLADWYVLKDPRQFYYATWTMTRARQQDAMESNLQFVEQRGMLSMLSDALREKTLDVLMPLRHAAWGANMNNASICAYGYGTAFTAPAMFHAMDNLGVAQYLTRLGLAMGDAQTLDDGKQRWLDAPEWQGLRRLVEDTLVVQDPFELFVAQNLAIDGLLYPLVYGAFVDEHVALQGGTAVAMLTSFMPEWHAETARWVDALVKAAAAESDANRALISQWAAHWSDRAQAALTPVAERALGAQGPAALSDVVEQFQARCKKAGLAL